jgi:hypothetical protein
VDFEWTKDVDHQCRSCKLVLRVGKVRREEGERGRGEKRRMTK